MGQRPLLEHWGKQERQIRLLNKAEVEALRQNVQLLARVSLQHEDELVQSRFKKEFLMSADVGS